MEESRETGWEREKKRTKEEVRRDNLRIGAVFNWQRSDR